MLSITKPTPASHPADVGSAISSLAKPSVYVAIASGNWDNPVTWAGKAPPHVLNGARVVIPGGIEVIIEDDILLAGKHAVIQIEGVLSGNANGGLIVESANLIGGGEIQVKRLVLRNFEGMGFSGSITSDYITAQSGSWDVAAQVTVTRTMTIDTGMLSVCWNGSLTFGPDSCLRIWGGELRSAGGPVRFPNSYSVTYKAASANAGIELTGRGLSEVTVDVGPGNSVSLCDHLMVHGRLRLLTGTLVLNGFDLWISTAGDISPEGYGTITSDSRSNMTLHAANGISGNIRIKASSSVGDFNMDVGAKNFVTLGDDLTVSGTLTLQSGMLVLGPHALTIADDIAASGYGKIASRNDSQIIISAPSSLSGVIALAEGAQSVGRLVINVPGRNSAVCFDSDICVHQSLNLVSGKLLMGCHTLTMMRGSLVSGAVDTAYIVLGHGGSFGMYVGPTNHKAFFPIGTPRHFAPAAVRLNRASSGRMVYFGIADGVHANGTEGENLSISRPAVNVTWFVESDILEGLDMNLDLMWSPDMEVNGFDHTRARLAHHTLGNWDMSNQIHAGVIDSGMYRVREEHIRSLSAFAVFDDRTLLLDGQLSNR